MINQITRYMLDDISLPFPDVKTYKKIAKELESYLKEQHVPVLDHEDDEEFSEKWPNIVKKGDPPADGEKFQDEGDKFKKYFSEKPGTGSID